MNTSSSGGFLRPNPQAPTLNTTPPRLSLTQFLQTLLVGLSGVPSTLCRPEWQPEPPKQPDLSVNWIAFGLQSMIPDFNAYVGYNSNNDPFLMRNELIQLSVSVYGPDAYDLIGVIRDGLQLTQNLTSLRQANIGFAYDSEAHHIPDFLNGRFIDRYVTDFFFRRQIIRDYPILSFVSLSGTIYTQTAEDRNFTQTWQTGS